MNNSKMAKISVFVGIYKDLIPSLMDSAMDKLVDSIDSIDFESEEDIMRLAFSTLSQSLSDVEEDVMNSLAKLKSNPELMKRLTEAAKSGTLDEVDVEALLGFNDDEQLVGVLEDDDEDKLLN